jgi:hypothetical protein
VQHLQPPPILLLLSINTDGQNAANVTVAAIIPNSDINFNVASLASNTTANGSENTKIK